MFLAADTFPTLYTDAPVPNRSVRSATSASGLLAAR